MLFKENTVESIVGDLFDKINDLADLTSRLSNKNEKISEQIEDLEREVVVNTDQIEKADKIREKLSALLS